ncbi:MAG: hypothetical protein ABIX10_00720 [Acidimicrobiales bacterium]
MALDARHRTSIYQKLLPILGDDDTNALMTEYPSIEADELVTKQFLRAELAITRGDLRAELAITRGDLRAEMAELRAGMASLETRLLVRMGAAMLAQTTLLVALLR